MSLTVKIFADSADRNSMLELNHNPLIQGFTTNPTLMRRAGVTDYRAFATDVLAQINTKTVSFSVVSDNFAEMETQAHQISSWGKNVYVKIPITNTKGEICTKTIETLSKEDMNLNVTAVLTLDQVERVIEPLSQAKKGYISIAAGRIADSGREPKPFMEDVLKLVKNYPSIEVIWASPRELYNIKQADEIGCHIITATIDILRKLPLLDKDLATLSLDMVQMFHIDAVTSGFTI